MIDKLQIITLSLQVIILVLATHFLLTKLLPKLKELLESYVDEDDAKTLALFVAFILIVMAIKILVDLLLALNNTTINYVSVLNPGLNLVVGFLPYFQWILVAVIILVGLSSIKK